MSEIKDKILEFWGNEFVIDDKREAFKKALAPKVQKILDEGRYRCLEVDYDPFGELFDATLEAGVPCRGNLFSADGIFAWNKTRMYIFGEEEVKCSLGYGALLIPLDEALAQQKREKERGGGHRPQ